ncbi:hypothetical protein PCL_08387 [Purpureocillium lilacinum]|uniref:Uncharacterized protein n=1 Tax=Purpureocillium lilacinum TaxID=33203 RepID=A0A2U3DRR0_PURLI|nr:hypothetical protein PCL_08387 [Purpureocillium lilacinum]
MVAQHRRRVRLDKTGQRVSLKAELLLTGLGRDNREVARMSLGLCLCVVDWRQAIAGSGGGVVSLSPRLERNMLVMIQRELEWPRELVSMMKDTTNQLGSNGGNRLRGLPSNPPKLGGVAPRPFRLRQDEVQRPLQLTPASLAGPARPEQALSGGDRASPPSPASGAVPARRDRRQDGGGLRLLQIKRGNGVSPHHFWLDTGVVVAAAPSVPSRVSSTQETTVGGHDATKEVYQSDPKPLPV